MSKRRATGIIARFAPKARKRLRVRRGKCGYCDKVAQVTHIRKRSTYRKPWLEQICAFCFANTETYGGLGEAQERGLSFEVVVNPSRGDI